MSLQQGAVRKVSGHHMAHHSTEPFVIPELPEMHGSREGGKLRQYAVGTGGGRRVEVLLCDGFCGYTVRIVVFNAVSSGSDASLHVAKRGMPLDLGEAGRPGRSRS